MTTATENSLQAPSRLALDNIVETMDALVDEAMAITGSPRYYGQATITLSHVPADIWHAMHGEVHASDDYTWKEIARHGSAHISAFCEHDAECPDRPLVERLISKAPAVCPACHQPQSSESCAAREHWGVS